MNSILILTNLFWIGRIYLISFEPEISSNLIITEENEILFDTKIWNSNHKDDNKDFHMKYAELINKEKFKKKGVKLFNLVN